MVITTVTAVLAGCSSNTIYGKYQDIPLTGWHKDSVLTFSVDITDTLANYNVVLSVRHSQEYPYQNLWFFIEENRVITDTVSEDSLIVSRQQMALDSLEYYLADERGRWLGNGFGDKKEMPCLIEQNVQFKHPGIYEYTFRHGMRENLLRGIHEVGLIVEKQ